MEQFKGRRPRHVVDVEQTAYRSSTKVRPAAAWRPVPLDSSGRTETKRCGPLSMSSFLHLQLPPANAAQELVLCSSQKIVYAIRSVVVLFGRIATVTCNTHGLFGAA
jgi:hypothetical protein